MEEPKEVPSEELGFGEILKLTFNYWGRKLPYFMVPYLIVAIISTLILFGVLVAAGGEVGLSLGLSWIIGTPEPEIDWLAIDWATIWPILVAGVLIGVIVTTFFQLLAEGLLVKYTADLHQGIEKPSLKESLSHAGSRFLSLLGAVILLILIVMSIVLLGVGIILAGVSIGIATNDVLVIIGIVAAGVILMGILIIVITTYFQVIIQCVILEDAGAVQSLKRSWYLVKGSWWKTFFLGIVILIITGIINAIGGVFTSLTDIVIVSMIISTIFNAIVRPIEIIAFTLLYFDLRARK